jgi:hypothetical protein
MPDTNVTLEVYEVGGVIQVSIGQEDERGFGHGYRIMGPSFAGNSRRLSRKVLNERDAREIASYVKDLGGLDEALVWKRVKPSVPGTYFRSNPPAGDVTRVTVIEGKDGLEASWLPKQQVPEPIGEAPDRFFWFGPIPPAPATPPEEEKPQP